MSLNFTIKTVHVRLKWPNFSTQIARVPLTSINITTETKRVPLKQLNFTTQILCLSSQSTHDFNFTFRIVLVPSM